jgi:hypothetical protein
LAVDLARRPTVTAMFWHDNGTVGVDERAARCLEIQT